MVRSLGTPARKSMCKRLQMGTTTFFAQLCCGLLFPSQHGACVVLPIHAECGNDVQSTRSEQAIDEILGLHTQKKNRPGRYTLAHCLHGSVIASPCFCPSPWGKKSCSARLLISDQCPRSEFLLSTFFPRSRQCPPWGPRGVGTRKRLGTDSDRPRPFQAELQDPDIFIPKCILRTA